MYHRLMKFVLVVTISIYQLWVPAIRGDKTFINLVDETLIQEAHAETKKKDVKKSKNLVRRFTAPKDGVITDTKTGLQWAQDAGIEEMEMTWDEANAYVLNLYLGGHLDWRLPTKEELESLLSYCKSKGIQVKNGKCAEYYNKIGFKLNIEKFDYYWSSSSNASLPDGASVVSMRHGGEGYFSKSSGTNSYVWPVRNESVEIIIDGDTDAPMQW